MCPAWKWTRRRTRSGPTASFSPASPPPCCRWRSGTSSSRPVRMVVITEPHVHVSATSLRGRERDTLCLTWEERRWTRKRVVTTAGREVALALPTGSVLLPGDVIVVEAGWYLMVEGRPEPVLSISPRDRAEAIRVAFDV